MSIDISAYPGFYIKNHEYHIWIIHATDLLAGGGKGGSYGCLQAGGKKLSWNGDVATVLV